MTDRPKIDNSIKQKRLVYKQTFFERFIRVFAYFMVVLAFPYISLMFILIQQKNNQDYTSGVLFLILSIIFSSYFLYNVFALNRLRRIKGQDISRNRLIMHTIMKRSGYRENYDSKRMTIAVDNQGILSAFGRVYTIIYDKEDILINCTTLGGIFRVRSPLHGIVNRVCENRIIKRVKENTFNNT